MRVVQRDATLAEIDEALRHAAQVANRDERWQAFVDSILDQRLEATA